MKHVVLMNMGKVEKQGPYCTLTESGHFTMLNETLHEDDRQGHKQNNASSTDDPSAVPSAKGQHNEQFRSTPDKDKGQTQKVDSVANNGIEYDSIINIDTNSRVEPHRMTERRHSIHPTPAQHQPTHQQHQSLYQPSPFSSSSMVFDGYDDRDERGAAKKRSNPSQDGTSKEDPNHPHKESQLTGRIGWRVYKSFFAAVESNLLLGLTVVLVLLAQASMSGIDYYISQWVNWEEYSSALDRLKSNRTEMATDEYHRNSSSNGNDSESSFPIPAKLEGSIFTQLSRHEFIVMYAVAMLFMFVLSLSRSFLFFYICLRATIRLHDRLFRGITRATMYFFNTNPSGRILNRFSRDIGCIDTFLPFAMMDCILFFVEFSAIIVLVAVVNYWLLFPTLVMAIIFYFLRHIYTNTARSIKRVEASTRSPIFSHANASFQGLSTIRAFGVEKILADEFDKHQDLNTSSWYLFLATTRAFAQWLELWGMRQTAELENQMTSVERVVEYAEVNPEPSLVSIGKHKPPAGWPNNGGIRFEHFSLRYSAQSNLVLRNLNMSINAGEKIGIVGRTGAGKSSIIQALFRLAVNEGIIRIDSVDIGTLGLHDLRKRISIIPQDPILFSGTVRENLDPFHQHDDDALWNALRYVELKEVVAAMEGKLDGKMSDGGTNFSMGQRQLVCLARAILRNNPILILDEATANVDPETDNLIQKTIREQFGKCTVLTIAHRLHTVMDSDRVLVMDAGKAVEYAQPYELLQRTDSVLKRLVNEMDESTAQQLTDMAYRAYAKRLTQASTIPNGSTVWLLDLLRLGVRRQIVQSDIYDNLSSHKSAQIGASFEEHWRREISQRHGSINDCESKTQDDGTSEPSASQQHRPPAPWRLLRTIIRIYGNGVLVFGFVYSAIESTCRIGQPFLLGQLILYFDSQRTVALNEESATSLGAAYGYAVGIVMTVLAPIAIFHCYQLYLLQVGMKIRIGCCALIYRKILRLSNTTDGLSGTVINLMANDVSRFDYAVIFLHDLWKGPVELVIVAVLVYREIGPAGLIGIGFLLLFIPIQAWLGKKSAGFRMKAALATDERVRLTNEIMHGIQVIKMYVWEKPYERVIHKLRSKEIKALRGSAIIKSALFALRIVPKVSIFLTLVAYVYFDNALTARRVYMLISFFSVIHHSMVEFWPLAVTSAAEGWISLKRIQAFLLQKNVRDGHGKHAESSYLRANADAPPYVEFTNVHTTWSSSNFSLQDISFRIDTTAHRTVAIIGPIGAGKSTLLNLVIGEQSATQGKITMNGTISYCSQKPWLFEGTVQQNVIFLDSYDEKRYRTVVKVCALEHDIILWPHGDQTMVGERGYSLSGGQKARINLARALYRSADIYLLDDPLSAVDAHVANVIFEQAIRHFLAGKLCLLVTHQLKYINQVEHVIIMEDGRITGQGHSSKELSEFFISHERSKELKTPETDGLNKDEPNNVLNDSQEPQSAEPKEKEGQEDGTVLFKVYMDFLKSVNSISFVVLTALLMIGFQVASSGTDYFVFIWVDWEETYNNTLDALWTTNDHIWFYAGVIVITVLLTTNSFAFFEMCLKASLNLHAALYRGVSETTMLFFYENPSGRIMNRFSKDIGLIDTGLPTVMVDSIYFFLELSGIIVIVAMANYWLLIPTAIMGSLFYLLRFVFLRTARNVKRVEAITRSPVFTHTNATIDGLTTIRAFGAESFLEATFHQYQDINTSAAFLFGATTRGFAFWLDVICLLYIASVVLSFLVIGNGE
uniref:Uncharacterized protein n=1 Tax=Anopheles christyi TaxID=43041 RepID=A0A182K606_9DIPT